ncbi:cytochrome C [Geoalkalibacter sp.]|uniref:cytochrome C n=1 Tax=Geoalkalibacter sp. TaxID=3041440 RepID=UPI00272E424F|nr:cytochrome C [Geoalkalibacter sp.]
MTRKLILTLVLLAAGATLAWGMRFDHRAHLEDYVPGTSCDTCHLPDAPSIVPDKKVCLDCHDQDYADMTSLGRIKTHGAVWALNHRSEAKSGAMDCAACHQQSFCLDCHKSGFADEQGDFGNAMINVHKSDFHITHPIAARTNQQLCSSCHEPSFCSDCHNDFRGRIGRPGGASHVKSFGTPFSGDFAAVHGALTPADSNQCFVCHSSGSVAANFHDWSVGHAREARRSLATCQACHPSGDVCLSCHSAKSAGGIGFNPHGKDWNDRKNRLNDASNGKTCRQCH